MSQAFFDKTVVQMPERANLHSTNSVSVHEVEISSISYSPYQTREIISDDDLLTLSTSIKERGVLQPIIIRAIESGSFELVAGERRLRAAVIAGLTKIPAIVRDLDNRLAAEISVIENAQRENLDPIEQANAYKQLIDSFKMTQTEVARIVGQDRSTISNTIRLLQLDQRIQLFIRRGDLSSGHGRVLLQVEPRKQFRLAEKVIREHISVHALEKFVANASKAKNSKEDSPEEIKLKAKLERQENTICELLKINQAKVAFDGEGRKQVRLTFESEAAWKRFMRQLKA